MKIKVGYWNEPIGQVWKIWGQLSYFLLFQNVLLWQCIKDAPSVCESCLTCAQFTYIRVSPYEICGAFVHVLYNLFRHWNYHIQGWLVVLFCGGSGLFHKVNRSQSSWLGSIWGDHPVHQIFCYLLAWMSSHNTERQGKAICVGCIFIFCKIFDLQHLVTAVYYPQSNGKVSV